MTSKTRSFRPSPPQIVDGTIRTIDLRDNAVAAGKIAPDAVDATEIAENGVESSDVAPDTLTSGDLGATSVTSSEVADQSLTANDLGPDSVGSSKMPASSVRSSELGPIIQVSNDTTIDTGGNASVNVACPAGTTVISGGKHRQRLPRGPHRRPAQWQRLAGPRPQLRPNNETLTVFAYCLTGGSSN
jgi:hypothetical protein